MLITSREPLGSPPEAIFRLPSLATPGHDQRVTTAELDCFDGVRLFLDRARQARPNLVVEDHNAHHVAAICARLDGIPLALELARGVGADPAVGPSGGGSTTRSGC